MPIWVQISLVVCFALTGVVSALLIYIGFTTEKIANKNYDDRLSSRIKTLLQSYKGDK